jgi:UDP-N-acetylmuramoyl-L-alanyl-D-glutamate--2,6-diaminopimelate ligase
MDEAELGWRFDDRPWIGVTGSNGKSTVAELVARVLDASGWMPAVAGNTRSGPPLSSLPPDPTIVVAEISSFQLERTIDLLPELAVLTRLHPDHLDRHGSMEGYVEVKSRLFVRADRAVAAAALTADDPPGHDLAKRLRALGTEVRTFGLEHGADFRVVDTDWDLEGSTTTVETPTGRRVVRTGLAGPHNASNVAAALAVAHLAGVDEEVAVTALNASTGLPGRFQRLDLDAPIDVVVDFAKTALGLRAALATARAVTARRGTRIVLVISAAPLGTPETRAALGAEAGAGADVVVATVERWRPTDPAEPFPELVHAARSARARVEVVADRRAALERGLALAEPGDVLLVAGRGPGGVLHVGPDGIATPFDDAAVLRSLLGQEA